MGGELDERGIEAACAAYEGNDGGYTTWENLTESTREECRVDMRAAVTAYLGVVGDGELLRDDVIEEARKIDWVFSAGPIEMLAHRNDFSGLHRALKALLSADPES